MQALKRHALCLALLCLSVGSLAQNVFEIREHQMNIPYVNQLMERAPNSTDSVVELLELSVYISEKIKYKKGVLDGRQRLIEHFRGKKDIPGELRMLLFQVKYFEKTKDQKVLARTHIQIGDLYFENQLFPKAKEGYRKAIDYASEAPTVHYYALKRLAWSHQLLDENTQADSLYSLAVKMAEQHNDQQGQLWIYQQKGAIAHRQKDYPKEEKIALKVLSLAKTFALEEEQIIAINNLGYVTSYLGQNSEERDENRERARAYFDKVIAILGSQPNPKIEAEIYKNLGILYQNEQRLVQSDSALKTAGKLYERIGDTRSQAAVDDFRALVYYQKNDLHNAGVHNKKSINLAKSGGHLSVLEGSYLTQSLIYQALYDFENALESYKKHLSVRDSILNIDRDRQSGILQQQYFLERMEKELKLIWVKEELTLAELAKLRAEDAAKEDRIATLKKDAELNEIEAYNSQLVAKEQLQLRMIAEEQQKVQEERDKLTILETAHKLKEAILLQEKERAEKQEALAKSLQGEARINQLELEKSAARINNLIYALLILLLLIALVLFAYRKLRSKNKQIAGQKMIIAAEMEKSDQLLLNILPAQVAAELKEKGVSKPRQYDNITVIFTDFVGFTMISEKLTPSELVETLDKIFLEFDLINERFGLQRIKTIGDAYMCACGLPEVDADHGIKAVQAALAMRDFVTQFNKNIPDDQPKWAIRIGVNSGPVVAGVVGIKKFAYDIWGDTVNVASRMESSGEAGKVNISESTHALVQNRFELEYRGKVKAKNKGEIDMYFAE